MTATQRRADRRAYRADVRPDRLRTVAERYTPHAERLAASSAKHGTVSRWDKLASTVGPRGLADGMRGNACHPRSTY